MKGVSAEKAELIAEGARHGFAVTGKQIDRWRGDRLLQTPGKAGGGRGRGVQRPAPEGSAAQLVRLCQFLTEDRSLDRAAFRLWIEDFAIPLERVREALAHLVPDPKLVFGTSPDQIRDKAEQYAEGVRHKKHVQPQVNKMADDGRLATMLEGFLGAGLGHAVTVEEHRKLGADFEELSGLNRARTDHWEGQSPWLTGDATPEFTLAASLLKDVGANLAETAPEEDFLRAKEAFKGFSMLRRCAALLQQLHGPNVFGFGVLTDLPIGVPVHYADPSAFLGTVALAKKAPQMLDNMIQLGETLQASLDVLRQQVENRS